MTTDRGEELGVNVFHRKYIRVFPYALYKGRGSLSQCILVTALGCTIERNAQKSQSSRISCSRNAYIQCSSKVIERNYLVFRVAQNHKCEGTEGGTYVAK